MLSPARRRQCVDHLQAELGISERRACAVAGQHRSTQRKRPRGRDDEEALTAAIIRLASQYGRYGDRRITALLRTEGWHVNAKRVQRIWRREGLKLPQKQPKRGRLWLNDGSCIRLRPCWPNHVWSYDFVMDRTHDGRTFRMLTVIDEFTRRCMAVVVERRLNSDNVLHCLTELFVQHGPPDHIRSDNGSEFTAHAVRDWLGRIGVKTLYIEPGSPWENGYNESFNSKLRDEILNTEIFSTLKQAKVLIERWRHHYNTIRPHSSLGYRPPAPETILPNVEGPTYPVEGLRAAHQLNPIELGQCPPLSDRALRPTWPAGSYPFRQRLRVYRSCRPRLARQDRRQDPLYRARVTLGERIQRELQLKAPGRNPEHGDLLYTEAGQSADRTMAPSL